MRRPPLYTLLFIAPAITLAASALAASERDIQSAVHDLQAQVVNDWSAVQDYACGGLLSAGDTRALAYYARKEPLECSMTAWCSEYDEQTGKCIGTLCEAKFNPPLLGVDQQWIQKHCESGSCIADSPPQSCSPSGLYGKWRSQVRYWDCGRASAECYSYFPAVEYASSYFPMAYNCLLHYTASPISPAEPTGQPALITPYEGLPKNRPGTDVWQTTPGSNVTTESAANESIPRDSSYDALSMDVGTMNADGRVVSTRLPANGQLKEYPSVDRTAGRLLQPPEVRLILPKGNHGLEYTGSPLFTRIFSSLGEDAPHTQVMRTLGNEPDALRTAAEYLRSIPLLEVSYVPVTVLIPTATTAQLDQLILDWQVWLKDAQQLATDQGVTFDPEITNTVQKNIATLRSYIALQDSIRSYRTHFPEYLDALLTAVEETNRFFRTEWVSVNAARLEDWHTAFTSYLPALQQKLAAMHTEAMAFTQECLASACRLDVLPVEQGTKPWQLIPPGSDSVLAGYERAWLPDAFPLWRDENGQVDQWHPFREYGLPLPDITLDLSEIFADAPIDVPLLKVETHQIDLPYPPALSSAGLQSQLRAVAREMDVLPDLHPPLFDLTFPDITLPNPTDSLFVVPEPPVALDLAARMVDNRTAQLHTLRSICGAESEPTTFLVHEFQLYDGQQDPSTVRDPAAVRAAAFVPGYAQTSAFGRPSYSWPLSPVDATLQSQGVYLTGAPPCPECSTVRPQRFIRQHLQLDASWERFQNALLTAIDTWNAQVKFVSVVPRAELTREDSDYERDSSLPTSLSPSP